MKDLQYSMWAIPPLPVLLDSVGKQGKKKKKKLTHAVSRGRGLCRQSSRKTEWERSHQDAVV